MGWPRALEDWVADEIDRRGRYLEDLIAEAIRLQDFDELERIIVVHQAIDVSSGLPPLPAVASWLGPLDAAGDPIITPY